MSRPVLLLLLGLLL